MPNATWGQMDLSFSNCSDAFAGPFGHRSKIVPCLVILWISFTIHYPRSKVDVRFIDEWTRFHRHGQITLLANYFPPNSVGKESTSNAGDPGSIPGLGRSPGEGNGNRLLYSCLGNPTDRGAVHGVARVGYDLASTPPPHIYYGIISKL